MEVIVLTPAQFESCIARAVISAMEAFAAITATATKEPSTLLTVKETAKHLRKSEKTIREYIKLKVLPADEMHKWARAFYIIVSRGATRATTANNGSERPGGRGLRSSSSVAVQPPAAFR